MRLSTIFGVAALFALTGCLSEPTDGVVLEKGRLTVENAPVAINLEITREIAETTNEGHLHVQVFVQNTNECDWGCQYRFQWFDAYGFQMSQAMDMWKPTMFHGRELSKFESVCPLEGAADFRLIIRKRGDR